MHEVAHLYHPPPKLIARLFGYANHTNIMDKIIIKDAVHMKITDKY